MISLHFIDCPTNNDYYYLIINFLSLFFFYKTPLHKSFLLMHSTIIYLLIIINQEIMKNFIAHIYKNISCNKKFIISYVEIKFPFLWSVVILWNCAILMCEFNFQISLHIYNKIYNIKSHLKIKTLTYSMYMTRLNFHQSSQ